MLESEIRKLSAAVTELNVQIARNNNLLEMVHGGPAIANTKTGTVVDIKEKLAEESRENIKVTKEKVKQAKDPTPTGDLAELDTYVRNLAKTKPGKEGVEIVRKVMEDQFGIQSLGELYPAQYGAFKTFVETAFK